MYVGSWIVKQKGLLELARNAQIFLTAGALEYRRSWFTSLDFQRRIAVLTLLLQHSQSIRVPGGRMPEEKNFFTGLFDFSFSHSLLRRLVKLLYVIAIVFGGITVVACVVLGYQQSPAQGLINLVAGIVALFVGVLLVRVLLELALAILRIAEGIERATHPGN